MMHKAKGPLDHLTTDNKQGEKTTWMQAQPTCQVKRTEEQQSQEPGTISPRSEVLTINGHHVS